MQSNINYKNGLSHIIYVLFILSELELNDEK
jgi:hypothetical protein